MPRDGRPLLVTVLRSSVDGASSAAPLVLPYTDTAAFAISVEPTGTVPTKPTDVLATGTAVT
jgi:anti-sigma-K factor RskA